MKVALLRDQLRRSAHVAAKNTWRLALDKRGNFSIILALVLTSVVTAGGISIDFAMELNRKSDLRNAIDAALLGSLAHKTDKEDQKKYAYELLDANMIDFGGKLISADFSFDNAGVLVGKATASVETSLLKIAGKDELIFSVEAGAVKGMQTGRPVCIMAMHPTRKHTLELKEKVSIYGTDCHIYGNSNHVDDVVDPHTPQNFITAASVTAVGYGHHFIQNVSPPLEGSTAVVADPFLSMSLPAVGSCAQTGLKIQTTTVTLDPGTYCDGLSITGGATVTLNPGVYVIWGNSITVKNSTLLGSGVTVYLADRHAEMDIESSLVRLTAPATGPFKSFVMIAKRDENTHVFQDSTLDFYGIVYMPNSAIEWQNTGTPDIQAQWTSWITDGFSWTGDGVINFPYNTKNSSVPHPSSLNVIPRPSLKEVVKLVY